MSRFTALKSRDFSLIFFGQIISLTGTQMQHVALAWQLYLLTHSPVSLGLIGFFRIVPVIVFALGGGVVADAIDRRVLMLVTQSALACGSIVLAIATITGHATPLTIYTVVFFSGIAVAFDNPARQSLTPLLVPREDLANAISMMTMAWTLATIAGPSIGGLILASFGVVPIYVADAASFLAVIAALVFLEHRGAPSKPSAISIKAAAEGLAFLRRTPLVLSTMLLDFFATFFGGSMLLMPIFANELLDVGAEGLGLLYAAQPAGAALAAAIMSVIPTIRRQGATLLSSVAIYGAAIVAFGLSPSLWISVLLLAISGAADTVSMVIRQTIRQLVTPDHLRGRMTSVNMIFFMGGPQLGEVEAGLVAGWIGARASVSSGGLLCILAVIATALVVPSLRRHSSTENAAAPTEG
jgi:MFS family permease